MVDADGTEHAMGDTGTQGIPSEGAVVDFVFPTPRTGTRFKWQCTFTPHANAFAIYTARPIFTQDCS
jgi:hypothetical protein